MADDREVKGHCPMGCGETLFLASGGYVTCSWHACPDPTRLADIILEDGRAAEHIVTFTSDSFTIRHPLRERFPLGDLEACPLHAHVAGLSGPPVKPGRYTAYQSPSGDWTWQERPTREASDG